MSTEDIADYTPSSSSSTPIFLTNKSKISIIEDYETRERENGYYLIASGVSQLQFENFLSENKYCKDKKFSLHNGRLLFHFKQGEIHDAVIQSITDQLKEHFGRRNILVCLDTPLRQGANEHYPDIQFVSTERIRAGNRVPCIVCEVAYSNLKLSELYAKVHHFLGPNNDILSFIGIKISYPTNPGQSFQAIAMIFVRGVNYRVPVRVVSFGSAPVTDRVRQLISTFAHPAVINIEGHGVTLQEPPNAQNDLHYCIAIPDNIFLRINIDDDFQRFAGMMQIPQYDFQLNLRDLFDAVHNGLWKMERRPPTLVGNLALNNLVDHLVDHRY
jgi:hypothetical protein